jgi:hypothetical protein
MKGGLLLLLVAGATALHAQVELPDIDVYNYPQTGRDPFISPQAPTTFLSEQSELAGVSNGELIRRFLEKLTASIKDQLIVGGVSTDDRLADGMALINGVTFRAGDRIPLEVDQKTLSELDQLAQSFGLTLERATDTAIAIEVGRITDSGVDLVLPGFRSSICQLPLERNEALGAVKLERKSAKRAHD